MVKFTFSFHFILYIKEGKIDQKKKLEKFYRNPHMKTQLLPENNCFWENGSFNGIFC